MPKLEPRLYVIVREDLTFKFIQGQHGVAQFALEHPDKFLEWNNQYVINLSVFNGLALDSLIEELEEQELDFSVFYEPDLGDKATSVVLFENGDRHVANALSKLRLASK